MIKAVWLNQATQADTLRKKGICDGITLLVGLGCLKPG